MSYKSIARSGAPGNMTLLKAYGGGSTEPRQAYATGGAVKTANPSLAEGLSAAGGAAKPSLSRPGRKMASKAKGKDKKGTQVNVVIAQTPEKAPNAMPPLPAPPPPQAGPPPMPPPMPPPGPGGPMPMRARGGKVSTKSVKKRADGGGTTAERLRRESDQEFDSTRENAALAGGSGLATAAVRNMPGMIGRGVRALGLGATGIAGAGAGAAFQRARDKRRAAEEVERNEGRAFGGPVSKKDAAVKIAKDEESPGRASGGRVAPPKGFDAGAGGAAGRLEKIKEYGK